MFLTAADPQFTWNLVRDVTQLFDFPFMVNAYRAGTVVAVSAAVIGWLMVLRRQTFAGHTLALIGFPGAAGAVLVGVSASFGYFAFAMAGALAIALLTRSGRRGAGQESAAIGTVQAFALGCGFLFISLSQSNISGAQALLFGSFVGITSEQVLVLFIGAALALVAVAVVARPLLFASIDPDVATARGIPVGALSVAFLLLLGVAAAEASQVTGSLLVFALLVLPAATAEALTARPALSLALAVVIALLVTWVGLALSYYNDYPIGFHITTLAFGAYLLAKGWQLRFRLLPLILRPKPRLGARA
ncbi:MAG: metal ABC transporter permease [Tepidiformaceae bacterium]